jgi:hypothetical protein
MDILRELGPDGEIFEDGTIHIMFPIDPELEGFDPFD